MHKLRNKKDLKFHLKKLEKQKQTWKKVTNEDKSRNQLYCKETDDREKVLTKLKSGSLRKINKTDDPLSRFSREKEREHMSTTSVMNV